MSNLKSEIIKSNQLHREVGKLYGFESSIIDYPEHKAKRGLLFGVLVLTFLFVIGSCSTTYNTAQFRNNKYLNR